MALRKIEQAALLDALRHLQSFIDAADGLDSTCTVFDQSNPFVESFTVEQRRAIRVYVESWVQEPLQAVWQAAAEGSRDWQNERTLRSYGEGWAWRRELCRAHDDDGREGVAS